MAEELNMHFSSVFTREDTSSIPVPETKFKGSEGERLGQLVVTPEVVVSKINNIGPTRICTKAYFIFGLHQWFRGRGNRQNIEICRWH